MRLEVKRCGNVHSELVAAVGWNAENELYSCGDDKQIARWNVNGDAGGKVRRHAASKSHERTSFSPWTSGPARPRSDARSSAFPETTPPTVADDARRSVTPWARSARARVTRRAAPTRRPRSHRADPSRADPSIPPPRPPLARPPAAQVCDLDAFVTAMRFAPAPADRSAGFAAACSDGTVRFFLRDGRVERTVEAHVGAVTSVRWTRDGACLLTSGEDGAVKSWSPSGRPLGVVAAGETAVYAAAWSPESHASGGATGRVVVARGKNLRVHAANAGVREGEGSRARRETGDRASANAFPAWRAHDGAVLAVDWCAVSGRLVSGGEDKKYKVWDARGRALFACAERDHAVTSVAWSPCGSFFAAGAFDAVWLCGGAGWSRETTSNAALGSTLDLAWSADGRALAGACAKAPGVFVGTVLDVSEACGTCVARLAAPRAVAVAEAENGATRTETVETRDRVGAFSFRHGHLVFGAGAKVFVYARGKWSAPKATVDLGGTATWIAQSRDGFAAAAAAAASGGGGETLRCFAYDGRKTRDVPLAATRARASTLSPAFGTVSLAPECLCLVRRDDPSRVVFLDTQSKTNANATAFELASVRHAAPVRAARLNSDGAFSERAVAFLDENRDLWIARVDALRLSAATNGEKETTREKENDATIAGSVSAEASSVSSKRRTTRRYPVKIAGGVDAFAWSESGDGLVAASRGGEVKTWHCATAFFVDPDLVATTTAVTTFGRAFGDGVSIERFDGTRATIRGGDGAVSVSSASGETAAFFPALHEQCGDKQWDRAIRLCRFIRDDALWACLAVRAVAVDECDTAIIAYAALEAIEKVNFLRKARAAPSVARRSAELKLFRREPEEAERVLLGAGLVFRAVELNLRLMDWDRALALALEHRTHIDTVLHCRAEHLRRAGGRREDKPAYAAAAREVEVSEEQVEAKIAREREREKTLVAREETARAGAKDRSRVAPTAKPSAAKAPVAARPAGTRTGSSRR